MKIHNPPIAAKIPEKKTYHGHERIDNYDWMRDKKSEEFIEYLNSENRYYSDFMKDYEGVADKMYNEMIARIDEDDTEYPYKNGDYFYYYKTPPGKEYRTFCRAGNSSGEGEEVILDLNKIVEEQNLSHCSAATYVSPDNKILMYGIDKKGDFSNDVYFKDLESGALLEDKLCNAANQVLTDDNKYVFYIKWGDVKEKGKEVYRHVMGTSQAEDELVYKEEAGVFMCVIEKSKSGKYVFITAQSLNADEVYYISSENFRSSPKLMISREKGYKCNFEYNDGYFYILTNYGCRNTRLMKTPVNIEPIENWQEVLPCSETGMITSMQMFKDYVAVTLSEEAQNMLKVYNINTGEIDTVDLPESTGRIYLTGTKEFDSRKVRFKYTSFTTPLSDYEYDMQDKTVSLLREKPVRGGFDKSDYISEKIFATVKDGSKVPISIVYKKGMRKDGTNPLYLYAYGSFGSSSYPFFNNALISMLDRGFVYGIAHVRGGREMGEKWWEEGKLLNKWNTFNDFIDCSEHLIKEGYTSAGKIAAEGGSAGGTLMGVVANERPELYKCLIVSVPAVDLLNTLLERSNFNAEYVTGEFGNPGDEEYYHYIRSYDPYENLSARGYPNILVTTGYNDGNVSCSEPAKYTAKLREYNNSDNVILLRTDFKSAHWGPTGKYVQYKEISNNYTFILKSFGLE